MEIILPGFVGWGCFAVTDALSNNATNQKRFGLTDDMIKGLSAGFGFFIALIFLICLVWYCCCTEDNDKKSGDRVINKDDNTSPRRQHCHDRNGRRLFS